MEKKRKRRDQRAVEITREPLRFTHQNLFLFLFFSIIISCYLWTVERKRRALFSLRVITCCAD